MLWEQAQEGAADERIGRRNTYPRLTRIGRGSQPISQEAKLIGRDRQRRDTACHCGARDPRGRARPIEGPNRHGPGPEADDKTRSHLRQLRREFARGRAPAQPEIAACQQFLLCLAGGVETSAAPRQPHIAKPNAAAAARSPTTQRIIFQQPQAFHDPSEQRLVLLAKHVHHHAGRGTSPPPVPAQACADLPAR